MDKKKTLKDLEKQIKKGVKRLKKDGYSWKEYWKVETLIIQHCIVSATPKKKPSFETGGLVDVHERINK